MRTAVDSSVLWCILNGEEDAPSWKSALQRASEEGELVICPVVFAELASGYGSMSEVVESLARTRIDYDPIAPEAAFHAGQVFRVYRNQGGPRQHLIPDFLIAAHAQLQADRLAAIDRGYLRRYFSNLRILSPAGIAGELPPQGSQS